MSNIGFVQCFMIILILQITAGIRQNTLLKDGDNILVTFFIFLKKIQCNNFSERYSCSSKKRNDT